MVRGRRNSQVCCHCCHRQNYYKSHHHFLPSLSNSSWMACSNLHCHLSTQCHHHHPSSLPSPMVNHSPSIITTITNGKSFTIHDNHNHHYNHSQSFTIHHNHHNHNSHNLLSEWSRCSPLWFSSLPSAGFPTTSPSSCPTISPRSAPLELPTWFSTYVVSTYVVSSYVVST